jgi:hypothetical protein
MRGLIGQNEISAFCKETFSFVWIFQKIYHKKILLTQFGFDSHQKNYKSQKYFFFLDPTLTSREIQQKVGDGEYVADPFVGQTPTTMDTVLDKCHECACGGYQRHHVQGSAVDPTCYCTHGRGQHFNSVNLLDSRPARGPYRPANCPHFVYPVSVVIQLPSYDV